MDRVALFGFTGAAAVDTGAKVGEPARAFEGIKGDLFTLGGTFAGHGKPSELTVGRSLGGGSGAEGFSGGISSCQAR